MGVIGEGRRRRLSDALLKGRRGVISSSSSYDEIEITDPSLMVAAAAQIVSFLARILAYNPTDAVP